MFEYAAIYFMVDGETPSGSYGTPGASRETGPDVDGASVEPAVAEPLA